MRALTLRAIGVGRLVEVAVIVAILALGKPLFVPVTLAFYLAFVMTPPAERLERLGLPRALALASVACAALSLLAIVGSVLVSQAAELAGQMKTYSAQMSEKLSALRSVRRGLLSDLGNAVSELGRVLDAETVRFEDTTPVRVVSGGLSGFERVEQALGPLVHPLAVAVAVFVIAGFVVGHREDLRGRLIRLLGTQNVTVTTRTMAEAVNRVSHFLLAQACINAGFAAVIAGGLYAIGVPYALLWGVLAGILRFVPLIGGTVAALLPALVAFAIFPGWHEVLLTAGLFLVVDLLTANLVEPIVLGKRAGVSALALLISALFWAWLWGPLGLVLATPLTVCLAVVGRHVQSLAFLTILLGDEPGLEGSVDFYQRILAGATRDALRLAKRRVAETSLLETFEALFVPALDLMIFDQNQRTIGPDVAARVVKDMSDIARSVSEPSRAKAERSTANAALAGRRTLLALPAESDADRLLLELFGVALAQREVTLVTVENRERARAVAEAVQRRPDAVCIVASHASGGANTRFFCRRLRAELPGARLLVLTPAPAHQRSQEAAARLREAGANDVAYGLREASELLLGAKAAVKPERATASNARPTG
ncbi:MAG TPA: AI-2E family transporter [Polyangiaceae bacterium]